MRKSLRCLRLPILFGVVCAEVQVLSAQFETAAAVSATGLEAVLVLRNNEQFAILGGYSVGLKSEAEDATWELIAPDVPDSTIHVQRGLRYLVLNAPVSGLVGTHIVKARGLAGAAVDMGRGYTTLLTDFANVRGIYVSLQGQEYFLANDDLLVRTNYLPRVKSDLSFAPQRPSLSGSCMPDRQQEFFPADWPAWAARQPVLKYANCSLGDVIAWSEFERLAMAFQNALYAATPLNYVPDGQRNTEVRDAANGATSCPACFGMAIGAMNALTQQTVRGMR